MDSCINDAWPFNHFEYIKYRQVFHISAHKLLQSNNQAVFIHFFSQKLKYQVDKGNSIYPPSLLFPVSPDRIIVFDDMLYIIPLYLSL